MDSSLGRKRDSPPSGQPQLLAIGNMNFPANGKILESPSDLSDSEDRAVGPLDLLGAARPKVPDNGAYGCQDRQTEVRAELFFT